MKCIVTTSLVCLLMFIGGGVAFGQEAQCKASTANLSVLTTTVQQSRQHMRKQCVFFRSCKMACRSNKRKCVAGKKPKAMCDKWMPKKCADVCQHEANKPDCKKAQDAFWASVKALNDASALPACKAAYPIKKGEVNGKK